MGRAFDVFRIFLRSRKIPISGFGHCHDESYCQTHPRRRGQTIALAGASTTALPTLRNISYKNKTKQAKKH